MTKGLGALFLVIVLAALLSGCHKPSLGELPNQLSEAGAKLELEGGTTRYTDADMVMEVTYLSPENVELYFSRFRGGAYPNPFANEPFVVFTVGIRNKGTSAITFNPHPTMLVVEKADPVFARDFAEMYSALSITEATDIDAKMEAFRSTCYDTAEQVAPGEMVHKLLVFLDSSWVEGPGALMFNGVYVNGKTRSITVPLLQDKKR